MSGLESGMKGKVSTFRSAIFLSQFKGSCTGGLPLKLEKTDFFKIVNLEAYTVSIDGIVS
jgi:hypothetical protein